MRLQHTVGLITLFICLACGGWLHPKVDLIEVDRKVSTEAGFTLPVDARAIHVRDRATGDVRTTWFLYELPSEPLADLEAELEGDDSVVKVETAEVPPHWPDVGDAGFEAPDWWVPEGTLFRQDLPPQPGSPVPMGRMWAIHEDGRVFTWMWSWEGWDLEASGLPAN